MLNTIIFIGPSLSREEILEYLPNATIRPPVKRGDVSLAVNEGYSVIVIVDGVFFQSESVSHKEILFALKSGVKCYGSSSMGALRAFEMESFGMIGVGQIFEWYRSGKIIADDEVSLLYDPESGSALSDPMVNIRATFASATSSGVLTSEEEASLLKTCKGIYYQERTYRRVIKDSSLSDEKKTSLLTWVKGNAVDQKREDAKACLDLVRDACV
ncbi:MAG TPA: TfuA-related McrA-glycine thioamidation protein [Methanocorpusculum sp.]|nr:TfuA-related McrA-glycine thioamidation protein [Methanocorpusculum sp.]